MPALTESRLTSTLGALDWAAAERSLRERPYARLGRLLDDADCAELVALYDDDRLFRSRVDMARHRFGEGEYKYFRRPLPTIVETLRAHAYPPLAAIATAWAERAGDPARFPPTLAGLEERCRRAGQMHPTPLLLRYEAGGYNCLHQDLYGEVAFPLQLAVFLSAPGVDYTGGEFLLVQQRPRAQSVGEALTPGRGEAIVFATRHWPAEGRRGAYRVTVRHGVSRLHSGRRYTLGVIFHDAA
jgi:uncharacterized protein